MSLDPCATELSLEAPGPRRLVHALAHQAPLRFASRVLQVGTEVALAGIRDGLAHRDLATSHVIRAENGSAPAASDGRRIALYLHYAPSGRISPMIREQLRGYRALGFDVVLATNAEAVVEEDLAAAADHCWKVLRRRNLGLDFGAWKDAAALLLSQSMLPEELLLVNDSVLGPIRPLAPLLARARSLGEGAIGFTESWQGGVHLQSYFILLRGQAIAADTLSFLSRLRLSTSKWVMVQRGEFGLTRYLVRRGHRVMSLFGYVQALNAILSCPEERRYVASLVSRPEARADEAKLRSVLLNWPLNPTIHLWRGLPLRLQFPFLKTSVLSQNAGRLPGVAEWSDLLCGNATSSTELIRQHLLQIGRAP